MTLPDGLNLVHRVFDNGWLLVDEHLVAGLKMSSHAFESVGSNNLIPLKRSCHVSC